MKLWLFILYRTSLDTTPFLFVGYIQYTPEKIVSHADIQQQNTKVYVRS